MLGSPWARSVALGALEGPKGHPRDPKMASCGSKKDTKGPKKWNENWASEDFQQGLAFRQPKYAVVGLAKPSKTMLPLQRERAPHFCRRSYQNVENGLKRTLPGSHF